MFATSQPSSGRTGAGASRSARAQATPPAMRQLSPGGRPRMGRLNASGSSQPSGASSASSRHVTTDRGAFYPPPQDAVNGMGGDIGNIHRHFDGVAAPHTGALGGSNQRQVGVQISQSRRERLWFAPVVQPAVRLPFNV